jgi:prepilin-type N-terminal cleavage/methylation domain-containing protein/prepilin-type processing-associated H-X9-DG protein
MLRIRKDGFTIVELLVVIGIAGILIALLLPAVQSSREAARRAHCQNNLKQLALGATQHLDAHKHLPTGGWGYRWAGDPDRGFDQRQPGGWIYNILPFIEQQVIRDLGKGQNMPEKRLAGQQAASTPITTIICPTRRPAMTYPYRYPAKYYNIDQPSLIARSDYAANAGDKVCCQGWGPRTLEIGDTSYKWRAHKVLTGTIYQRSAIRSEEITDGLSKTYLLGEKYLRTTDYDNGKNLGDDQGWNAGYVKDNQRWTVDNKRWRPRQDSPKDGLENFGSPHPGAMQFAFADGSVHTISYDITPKVHAAFGNRKDDQIVSLENNQ